MALDREIRRLLEYARLPETETASSKDVRPPRPTTRGILERLITIQQQTTVPSMGVSADMNLPELLVLTGEAAIFQGDFDTASQSVEWFFGECQLKNQFYCRAQFVRAHCGSHDAQADTGVTKLKKVLNAIHFVMAVIPIATDTRKRPTYDFLVYNASVTYWQIARQLMKQSTFQFLVPSLTSIIDALKLTGETDVMWLLRLQLALVYAQMDANQLANAAKTINDVVDVQITPRLTDAAKVGDDSFKALYEEALRTQVHVGSFKDAECQKIVPNVKRLIPPANKRVSLLVKLQCVKSGNVAGTLEAAYTEIFQEATGLLAFTSETPAADVKSFADSLELKALEAIDAEVLAEIAISAAFNNSLPISEACDIILQRKGKSVPSKVRVLHQVLGAIFLVVKPSGHSGNKTNARQRQSMLLARRVEAIKALERALLAGKRQQDPQLVERICIYAWNLSLPLMQPHLRSHLTRVFGLSSSVLEELESLLLGFRARLYLEVAKLEVASDFLAKAKANVSKALTLDYGVISRSNDTQPVTVETLCANEDWVTRPVDMHLLPIKSQLDLKLSSADETSKSTEVLAMLEQVKEGKDGKQQKSILARCVDLMTEVSNAVESSASAAENVRLWSEISMLAWNIVHDGDLAQQVAEKILMTYFLSSDGGNVAAVKGIANEKSLKVIEVDMHLLLVDILAMKLKEQATRVDNARCQIETAGSRSDSRLIGQKSAGHKVAMDADLAALVLLGKEAHILGIYRSQAEDTPVLVDPASESTEVDENAQLQGRKKTFEQEIQSAKSDILKHITGALKAATQIGWTFILENTCIYLWNYHFHIFRMLLESTRTSNDSFDPQWILTECISAFEAVYAALEATPGGVDSDILANVGLGLSSIYEKTGRLDKALAVAETFLKRKTPAVSGINLGASINGDTGTLHLKRFVELKSRVQIAQNAKDIAPTDSCTAQLKVVAYLEAMEVIFQQSSLPSAQQSQLQEKAQALYQKAVTMWQAGAADIFSAFMNGELERALEEEQQQLELFVEVWVRIGCGAYRLRNFKYAVECAEQALVITGPDQVKKFKSLVVGSTWKWFSLAELLYGRAILALAQSDPPAKKLVLASLTHLVQATEYGLRGNNSLLVIRACEVIWNATILSLNNNSDDAEEVDENSFLDRAVDQLRIVLHHLEQVIMPPDANVTFYGEMVLLTLAVCEKANKWSDMFEICEFVLRSFGPASHRTPLPGGIMKDIQTTSAIAGAHLGRPSTMPKNAGGSKTPDQFEEALLQAQILKKVAFSSWKDPPAQLKALSYAHGELDGQSEEQSLVLVDIAEWLFTNYFPSQNAESYLECAVSSLLRCQNQKRTPSEAVLSRKASSNALLLLSKQKPSLVYSPLWFAEKLLCTFVMRAMISKGCTERAKYLRLALHQVENGWEHILDMANEIDLQTAFDQDSASKTSNIQFDEWKKDKPTKYAKPACVRDWTCFFLEYEENLTNRFYMPWVKTLQSTKTPNTCHITQPVLTMAYLEELLLMLRDDGLQYTAMIPPFCLLLVLFHAYIPQKTCIAQIWLDLCQSELLERLNITRFSLPLQNALEIILSHGETLIKDLQDVEISVDPEGAHSGRRRCILHASRLDSRGKAISSIQLLLRFGFVRQAKTLFEILRHSVSVADAFSSEVTSECDVLASQILEMEGQTELALVRMENALECPRLDIRHFLEWTLRRCKLNPDHSQSLHVLQAAEKEAATAMVAGMRNSPIQRLGASNKTMNTTSSITSNGPDIDVVKLVAQVLFKRATIWLKRSVSSEVSRMAVYLQESKQSMEKSLQMLAHIDADYESSRLLLKYSRALFKFAKSGGALELISVGLDASSILQEALKLMENCVARLFQFSSVPPQMTGEFQREAIVSPMELNIAMTKVQVAGLLMAPEMSAENIKEKEMTWYRYYENSQRNVVEKWLATTESSQEKNISELPRAMALITSAIETLGNNPAFVIQHAIAQVLRFQCERLALFHGDDKQTADAIRHRVWTRFTSGGSREATWVCCHGAQSEAVVAAEDAAAIQNQAQLQAQAQIQAQTQDEELENEDDLQPDEPDNEHLDEMLSKRIVLIQKYQLISFEKRCAELLRLSSYELVQLMGCKRPFDCAKNLLKHQSTEVIETSRALFAKCVAETNVQRLHLRRMRKLQKTHTNAAGNSLSYQLSQLYLDEQSDAFKRMSVGTRVDTIVAALPSAVRVLCLHFSPDRCFLYAAILGSTERRVAIARMEFTDSQQALLEQLQKRMKKWQESCAKETMAYDDANGQDEMFEFLPVELHQSGTTDAPAKQANDTLEEEFTGIVNDTIGLLKPLFSHSSMRAELKTNLVNNMLVLLVDQVLACLPLEALPSLQPADSITRDFSIQMLHQRILATKKQQLRPAEMRFIVDPYKEDPGNASDQTMTSVVKQANVGWKDAFEHGQIPSVTDWQQALHARRGGGLMYVGPNRVLGSCLPLKQVTGMNMALTCQALILLDHAENSKSLRRQSKVDSEKTSWELEVESDPYARALLLTLCGANVLVLNQWATTFNGNRRLANGLFQGIAKGYSVGRALKRFSESSVAASTTSAPLSVVANTTSDSTLAPGSPTAASDGNTGAKLQQKNRFRYNPLVYGLANLVLRNDAP